MPSGPEEGPDEYNPRDGFQEVLLTYEHGKEDVLRRLNAQVQRTSVPGAQEAYAQHLDLRAAFPS
jgi:hypothetical protein